MANVKKRLVFTEVFGVTTNPETCEMKEARFVVPGKKTREQAQKIIRRDNADFLANAVAVSEKTYQMSINDFIAHAEVVPEPNTEQTETN